MFYYIRYPNGKLINLVKRGYSTHYQLEDGSLLVDAPKHSIIPAEFKCGMEDARQIVQESGDSALEFWYQGILDRIRRKASHELLGRGRLE